MSVRTALLLSGHLRAFKRCYNSLYQSVIVPTKADVFLHTWDFKLPSVRGDDVPIASDGTIAEAVDLYKPVSYIVEHYTESICKTFLPQKYIDAKHPQMHESHRGVENCMAMYYGIKRVHELYRAYELINGKYDVVIRSRTDLQFESTIDLNDIVNSSKEKHVLYTPTFERHDGLNDQFALGGVAAMSHYAAMYDSFDRHVKNGVYFNPELMLHAQFGGAHIRGESFSNGLNQSIYELRDTNIMFSIVR